MVPFNLFFENVSLSERTDDKKKREVAKKYFDSMLSRIDDVPSRFSDEGGYYDFSQVIGIAIYFLNFRPSSPIRAAYKHSQRSIIVNINKDDAIRELYKKKQYKNIMLLREPEIIHELIHYLDFERISVSYTGHEDIGDVGKFNTPLEFNAYFQAQAHMLDKRLELVKKSEDPINEFILEFGKNCEEFISRFWDKMAKKDDGNDFVKIIKSDEKYKFKWNKRLYQLYYELKDELMKDLL